MVQVALGGLSLRVSYGPQPRVVSPAPQTCQLIASPTAQRPPAIALMEMAPSHPVVLATGKDAAEPAPAASLRLQGAAPTLKYPPRLDPRVLLHFPASW